MKGCKKSPKLPLVYNENLNKRTTLEYAKRNQIGPLTLLKINPTLKFHRFNVLTNNRVDTY